MTSISYSIVGGLCPVCKRSDALGRPYRNGRGGRQRTCHGLNRPEHPGYKVHFDEETGEVITVMDGMTARILSCIEAGQAFPLRGFPEWFLDGTCGVTAIPARTLGSITAASMPELEMWALEMERDKFVVGQFPIHRGARMTGIQFRALRPLEDRPGDPHQIRTFGSSEGLFIPNYIGRNPRAVVLTEGPWDAVAITYDALQFQNKDIFAVAALSASVSAYTIKTTLDAVFPGVPRFGLWDQDPAGVAARIATAAVIKPILVMGAGHGKDYRELNAGDRFERLLDVINFELRAMGYDV